MAGGRTEEAEHVAARSLAAFQLLEPDTHWESFVAAHEVLALARHTLGRIDVALADVKAALETPGLPGRLRARLWILVARNQAYRFDLTAMERAAQTALAEAGSHPDPLIAVKSYQQLAYVQAFQGDHERALELLDGLEDRLGDGPEAADTLLSVRYSRAWQLSLLDRVGEAETELRRALRAAERGGVDHLRQGDIRTSLIAVLFETGQWDEARTECAVADELIMRPQVRGVVSGAAALVLMHRGDIAGARRWLPP